MKKTVDLSSGRFNVYSGRGPLASYVGRIDNDEYVRDDAGSLLYRVDGDEFYDMGGVYIGAIEAIGDIWMVISNTPSEPICRFEIRTE